MERWRALVDSAPPPRVWTRWGWITDADGARAFTVRREKLDPMIRELAASTPGVDFLPGHT